MRMLSRFWSGLEALPGLAGVLLDWQEVWRKEITVGRAFLRPTRELATSYPCPYPGGDGCPRGVVMHGEQDIVAVCRSVPRQCETVKLTKADIVIYELDWKALGAAIAAGLGLAGSPALPDALPLTAPLGWHCLTGGKRATVYLTIQYDPQGFAAILSRLLADADPPFILAAPTSALCEADSSDLLRRMRVLFLPLDECLAWDGPRGFVPTERLGALLSDLAAAPAMPTRQIPLDDSRTLRVDLAGSLCYFRNVPVNLSKMPFDVLVLLAKEAQGGPRWVSRARIFETCWHEDWENDVAPDENQISKMVSEVRGGFRAATGMSDRESRQLIARKSKTGYRLNLPADEIEII